jgi:hypothetical protein
MAIAAMRVATALPQSTRALSPQCWSCSSTLNPAAAPFEVGNQVLISSHRKLLSLKAMVVNVAGSSRKGAADP